jgi:hypothetical protein
MVFEHLERVRSAPARSPVRRTARPLYSHFGTDMHFNRRRTTTVRRPPRIARVQQELGTAAFSVEAVARKRAALHATDLGPGRSSDQTSALTQGTPMKHHIPYSDAERQLASAARATAMNGDVLYHGTRYPRLILATRVLFRAESGNKKVCLSRSPEAAAYWVLLPRNDDRSAVPFLSWIGNRLKGGTMFELSRPYCIPNRCFTTRQRSKFPKT